MKSIKLKQARIKGEAAPSILGKTRRVLGKDPNIRENLAIWYLPEEAVVVATLKNGSGVRTELIPIYNISTMIPENVKDLGFPSAALSGIDPDPLPEAQPVVVKPGTLPEKPAEPKPPPAMIDALKRTGPKHVKPDKLYPIPVEDPQAVKVEEKIVKKLIADREEEKPQKRGRPKKDKK
jgi:hypothetical protein